MCVLVGLLVVTSALYVVSETEGQCPPWFLYDGNITISNAPKELSSHCICSEILPSEIECDFQGYSSSLALGYCAFWISSTGNNTGHTVVGACPYVFPVHLYENNAISLPRDVHSLNYFLCSSLNRETGGKTCGKCANGTGPSVSSVGSKCAKCSALNVLYYILLHYVPATVIFLLIMIFQVNITSSSMAHYVLYCNALTLFLQMPGGFPTYLALTVTGYRYTVRSLLILYSLWSFDPLSLLSPDLCISSDLENIHVLYLEMLKTLYPFLLLFLAYVSIELYARDYRLVLALWRPVQRSLARIKSSWNPHAALVQAFATIFFLSYIKMLFLVSASLNWTDFITEQGTDEKSFRVTYIDPTVPIHHSKHTQLMVVSMTMFSIIILPPILLLLLYPTRLFRKLQNYCFSPRVNLAFKIFVSTFQGGFKDGMNGTWDYRGISGAIFLGILVLMAIHYSCGTNSVIKHKPVIIWQTNVVIFIAVAALIAVVKPYKSELTNNTAVCLCALLGIGAALHIFIVAYFTVQISVINAAGFVLSIPHLVVCGYFVYRLSLKMNCKKALKRLCQQKPTELEEQSILTN